MRALPLVAALLLAAAPHARADEEDDKVAPAQYQQVPADQYAQIVAQHQQMAQDLKGKSRDEMKAYFAAHKDVEPYLNIPSDPAQQKLFNDTFGKGAFETTHNQAHFLLMNYAVQAAQKPGDSSALQDGVSKIIGGVSQVIGSGLQYAGVMQRQDIPPDQKKEMLVKADASAVAAGKLLETVPIEGKLAQISGGHNAESAMLGVEPILKSKGLHGMMSVYAKVTGWDHVQQVVGQNPANPVLNVSAGDEALSENDPSKAKQFYNNALSIDPGNSSALSGRAAANMDLGNVQAAAQDAKDALRIDPNDAGAKAVLQLAHDTAAGDVTIDKNNPFGQRQSADGAAGTAGAWGAGNGAPSGLKMGNAAGLQSSAFTREGFRLLEVGDDQSAINNASKAIALDPKNSEAYGVRAFALAHAGDYQGALRDAVAALALEPGNIMAQNARAKALNQMGMYHEALAAADDAIRANPKNAYAYYMRAMALNGLGDRKDMVAALGQAAALDPRFQDAYDLAKSAPDEKDLSFLFPEDQLAAARAALRGQAQNGPKRYFWGLTLPTIAAAALLLFGLLHFVFSWLVPRLRGGYQAAVRTGPSLGASPTELASLPTPPPFATGRHTPAGTVLHGQYRRLGQIGSSVHGAVYEGMDQALERRVVIRKLRADMRASDRDRLLGPARAAASLNHASIAPVYSVFEEGEGLYLVSEYAPGRSLRDWLAARGPLTWEEARPLFRQIAAALDYAHAKGIVHGAVKGSNVMIAQEGRAKLTDFGLDRGPIDKTADLQALAACLREAIAGLPPHRLDAVDAALLKARDRFGSAAQVVDVVESALASSAA